MPGKETCKWCSKSFRPSCITGLHHCRSCDLIITNLKNNSISPDEIYPDVFLKVTYSVCKTTHDGYCSDPYDTEEETKKMTKYYPLLKVFKKEDFDDHDMIYYSNEKLSLYQIEFKAHGNGYCECGTDYDIIYGELMKVKIPIPKVTLRDKLNSD